MLANRVRMGLKKTGVIDDGIYVATDADFSGTTNANFKYIGTETELKIPHVIKGVNVTFYSDMFLNTAVTKVVSDNPNVTNMRQMFRNSKATSLDLSSFDTSSVTNMGAMFDYSSATSLDLSSFNTSKVTNMSYMFSYCKATSLDLSSFDTSSVTNMDQMFRDSKATSLDLSSFDTSSVTNMGSMFRNSSATTGYARTQADADKFNASSDKPAKLVFIVKEV